MNTSRACLLVISLATAACASRGEQLKLYKFSPVPAGAPLDSSGLAVTVDRAQSAAGATNYILQVSVANNGAAPSEFRAASLELIDSEGITHPPIDPSAGLMVTAGILHDQTVAPGRKIRGALYFQTMTGEARSKKLTLRFGNATLALVNAGFLTDKDLESQDPFRD